MSWFPVPLHRITAVYVGQHTSAFEFAGRRAGTSRSLRLLQAGLGSPHVVTMTGWLLKKGGAHGGRRNWTRVRRVCVRRVCVCVCVCVLVLVLVCVCVCMRRPKCGTLTSGHSTRVLLLSSDFACCVARRCHTTKPLTTFLPRAAWMLLDVWRLVKQLATSTRFSCRFVSRVTATLVVAPPQVPLTSLG